MKLHRRALLAASSAALLAPRVFAQAPAPNLPAGGRGGRIIRVTTLRPDGPGSIAEAIKAEGARVIVFEVGGVIDLGRTALCISSGDLTIAGQTAPSPGITLIRGGIEISQNTRNVAISNIAVRPGEAGAAKKSGWECDGIYAYGASDILVRNCSITWATDEGLSASGKRFGKDDKAATLEEWRAFTSHNIFFLNNIVAEGLSNSTHSKGEHSKGTLIHDNVRDVLVADSLYAHNMERNILFKGGAHGAMKRCIVYNPGRRFAHYNLHEGEWGDRPYQPGDVTISGNRFIAGPSTDPKAAAFMLGGEGDLQLAMESNILVSAKGDELAEYGTFGSKKARLVETPRLAGEPPPAPADPAPELAHTLANCGARPWDRDPIDVRIVADVWNGTGKIIDSEQEVGGYPVRPETHAPFIEAEWNLNTMERRQR
jgi:hypothetical protein